MLLISLDIISMYTNIPLKEAITTNIEAYHTNSFPYEINKINTSDFRDILKLVLENNFLEFNGNFYKERIGVAQGSKCSPEIADIFMHAFEKRFLDKIPGLILYKRYRDDIIILSEAKRLEFHSFLENLNFLHESIKFTLEMNDCELNFLDLTIYKGENFKNNGVLDQKLSLNRPKHFNT